MINDDVWSAKVGAAIGALSALVALAAAELIALLLPGKPTPVVGIADQIINVTPAAIRDPLISAVGTADKPLLVVGIVVVIAGAGAVVGIRIRRKPEAAWPVYVLLGIIVGLISAATTGELVWSLVAAVGGSLVGWATIAFLLQTTTSAHTHADGSTSITAEPALERRTFLLASAGVAVVAAVGVGVLTAVRQTSVRTVEAARGLIRLPQPVRAAAPVPLGAAIDLPDMPPPVTPNDDFYRIDTALVPPTVDPADWTLSIAGLVDSPFSLTYDDLLAMPQIEKYVTLACVSNPVGGDLVGNALWQGVPLREVLNRAGIGAGAEQVVAASVDGFTAAFPLQIGLDDRDAMIAVGMNGEPLPIIHGFPARLVVPGLYGYVSATKWLQEIRLTTFAAETGFWIPRGWVADGTIEAASRIDTPLNRATLAAGNVVVAGRAWHQQVPIGGVEVSVDDGPWLQAVLAADMGIDTWRLWQFNWSATVGSHTLRVRMFDRDGRVQSSAVKRPGPGAASGYQSISVYIE